MLLAGIRIDMTAMALMLLDSIVPVMTKMDIMRRALIQWAMIKMATIKMDMIIKGIIHLELTLQVNHDLLT